MNRYKQLPILLELRSVEVLGWEADELRQRPQIESFERDRRLEDGES